MLGTGDVRLDKVRPGGVPAGTQPLPYLRARVHRGLVDEEVMPEQRTASTTLVDHYCCRQSQTPGCIDEDACQGQTRPMRWATTYSPACMTTSTGGAS